MKTEKLIIMGIKKQFARDLSKKINRLTKKENLTEKESKYRILSKEGML